MQQPAYSANFDKQMPDISPNLCRTFSIPSGNIYKKNVDNYHDYDKNQYDEKNNLLEEKLLKAKDSLDKKTVFTYDDKGNKTAMILYDGDGTILKKNNYSYDKQNNVTEDTWLDKDDNKLEQFTYKYAYDKQLNWTRKITFRNGVPGLITEREFVYFSGKK